MNRKLVMTFAGAALLLAGTSEALAQTAAGQDVNNTASVSFEIGGVLQTTPSTDTATFKVDRRVDLVVAEVGDAATSVTPGATNQVLTFTVTNNTNDTIDIALAVSEKANGTIFLAGANPDLTDDQDSGATFKIYEDADSNDANEGIWDGGDAEVTYLDQMTPGAQRTVFVVADTMPDDTVLHNNEVMVVELTGTAHSAYADQTDTTSAATTGTLGAILADDSGDAEDPNLVQNVFADAADAETGNAANDGTDSAYDAYQVAVTDIVVTKTYGVLKDPVSELTGDEPKAIPGATVVYCITVENNGSTNAANVTVSDPVPSLTSYVPGTLRVAASAVDCSADPATAAAAGTGRSDTNGDADGGDLGSASAPWNGPITTVTAALNAGTATTTIFQVTID